MILFQAKTYYALSIGQADIKNATFKQWQHLGQRQFDFMIS